MSKLFSVNFTDLAKGAATAAFTTILAMLYAILNAGGMPTSADWKNIGMAAAAAFGGYIAKNLFTNSSGELLASEKPAND